jgi:AAA15 family ATPase/GTPase
MLVEFKFKNFKSFRDKQVLSMIASSDKTLLDNTFATIPPGKKGLATPLGRRRLVRSSVLYGANASGKSNLVKAFAFLRNFVVNSAKNGFDSGIHFKPFLLDTPTQSIAEFEVTFIHEEVRYQYGFSVDQKRVHEEWLTAYPRGLPQTWFERKPTEDPEEPSEWYFGSKLVGEKSKLKALTRPDVLFLSVAATFNHKQLSKVYEWFLKRLLVIDTNRAKSRLERFTAMKAMDEPEFHKRIKTLLQFADLGIKDFQAEEKDFSEEHLPKEMSDDVRALISKLSSVIEGVKRVDIQMKHEVKNIEGDGIYFSIVDESYGTQRFFALSGSIIDSLTHGYTMILDELDTSLHPILVRAMLDMFHTPSINPHNAQLIFNTHDTTLLNSSLFRRDQIWFVEKDNSGASHIYPLLEFSPRKDEALERGYLQGRYGAIPFIEDLSNGFISNA